MDVTFPDYQIESDFAPQPFDTSPPGETDSE
jgi:hypothetical protein